jgi:hypothetical protein
MPAAIVDARRTVGRAPPLSPDMNRSTSWSERVVEPESGPMG